MPATLSTALGLVVIAAAVVAIARRVDVRLVLLLAALALGGLAGDVGPVVRKFFETLANEQFVLPICTAMGFAQVLRHSGCDRHLVHLLARPLRRAGPFLIPGAVLVGFVVNVSVISQASTAVAVGTVLVPLLRSAGLSPVTVAAALSLGASVGGEVLNPGAPEINTIAARAKVEATACVERVAPVLLLQLAVALAVFWPLCLRAERAARSAVPPDDAKAAGAAEFRVNLLKALVPVIPLALLMIVGPPFNLVELPRGWLVDARDTRVTTYSARLVGVCMLAGTGLAALTAPRTVGQVAGVFFEGAGSALARIVSIIVVASCFAEGVILLRLNEPIAAAIRARPDLVWPLAGGLTLLFAVLCGSGYAATQSLYGIFVTDAMGTELMLRIGAVVSVSAAAGRTMSPVAVVNLTTASLAETEPLAVARRVAVPLLVATTVTVTVAWLRSG
ncbi:MAG TPA: C4-dicarboxylate transporter DcuC [Gemmataceae bacterium]|jgi:DcuC family C4-dicarboxylate transporter